ncbi:hypothetical protein V5G24_20175 [Xanthobacter sp. VTT E-85241]
MSTERAPTPADIWREFVAAIEKLQRSRPRKVRTATVAPKKTED